MRRLLRQQPDVLRLEGQLPEKALPGLYEDGLEEEEQSQRQQQPQGGVLAAGGNARPPSQQLSIAERVRQQLAAKVGGKAAPAKAAGAKPAMTGKKRAVVHLEKPA